MTMRIDMRIGNTAFMRPYWQQVDTILNDSLAAHTEIWPAWSMDYEKEGGKEELKSAIIELHDKIGNAAVESRANVVIGNGATQLIFAALSTMPNSDVYAKKPYWFRFPGMVNMTQRVFRDGEWLVSENPFFDQTIEIITLPSNPENRIYRPVERLTNRIYDCCYHWPTYHDGMTKLGEDIMIFSLAKATGHAGSRIGWAIVKNPEVAKKMARFIEMTTGGVSVEAQMRATNLITSQINSRGPTCFDHGRSVLKFRWKQLLKYPNDLFMVSNGSGMFAWCGLKEPIQPGRTAAQVLEEKTGIVSLNGLESGGDYNDFRLNMGCDEVTWLKFIDTVKSLSKEVKK